MRYFQQIAAGVEVLPLVLDLYRQPALWDQNTARTGGVGSFEGTSDIWVRFRDPAELVSRESYAESFTPVFYDAWHALPHLRPIVFGLMARLEAVQLGGVLLTRIPPRCAVKRHNDRGRWHPEFFTMKAYVPLASNDKCVSTCADESIVMAVGSAYLFDNLQEHSTENNGDTDRITLIVSMRVE